MSVNPATNMVVWTQVHASTVFPDLQLRSKEKLDSSGEDVILMRVRVDHLRKALEHCVDNQVIKMSLRKKIDEMRIANLDFCFWEHTSRFERKGMINQRVIVSMISQQDALVMRSPEQSEDIFFKIPSEEWDLMAKIIKRFRCISETITISGSKSGELSLLVETEDSQVSTVWDNMKVVLPIVETGNGSDSRSVSHVEGQQIDTDNEQDRFQVTIRSREWEQAFQPHKSFDSIILGVAHDTYVTLISKIGGDDERALTYIYGLSA